MRKKAHTQSFVIPSEALPLRSGWVCGARDLFFAMAPNSVGMGHSEEKLNF
jgi:hypothetical protein